MDFAKYLTPYPKGPYSEELHAKWLTAYGAAEQEFRADLRAEFGQGLPKAIESQVFSMAWSQGHSCGNEEVSIHYENLADLARVAYQAGKDGL